MSDRIIGTYIRSKINTFYSKKIAFNFSADEQIVFMWFFYPVSGSSISLYTVQNVVGADGVITQLISAKTTGYNPRITISNNEVEITFANNYMGYMMFSTSLIEPKENVS